jgi:Thiol-disulfide isomerase and thioredoxins
VVALAGCVSGDSGTDDSSTGGATNNGDRDDGSGSTRPAWQTTTFEAARTGESLTVAEADGPVVLHTFATWCSVCHSQQQNLDTLHERRGDEVTLVDLTIDENDDPDDVAAHAEDSGFDWRFGVAPAELTSSLVDDVGDRVVFAPQSPVIVVCSDGRTETLGKVSSADAIGDTLDSTCS